MIKITENQAIILASLAISGEAHGHSIWKRVGEIRGSFVKIVTLYKALHSLEDKGLVEGRWEDQPEAEFGRPRRRIYILTGEGKVALEDFAGTQAKVAQLFGKWVTKDAHQ